MEVNNLNGDNNCNVGIMILNGGIILGLRLWRDMIKNSCYWLGDVICLY
jgi:hypothetical protein